MNAPQTSVSAMFDSAFEGLAAPASAPAPAFPQVAGFAGTAVATPMSAPAPPRKPIMKLALVVLATLGIAAALYLMFKKMKTKTKKTQKRRKAADLDSDDDEDNASDDDEESDTKPAKPQKMTTFAPLDMPAVNFPVLSGPSQPSYPPPQQPQPQNIRNSKGMRASEQIQGFPPPNIDVGLGSGTPPSMRPPATGNPAPQLAQLPPPPPPSADQNFNPL